MFSMINLDLHILCSITLILDKIEQTFFMSTMDLNSGFLQIAIAPDDRAKTGFATSKGLFQFKRMCFGLCNASATFMRLMRKVFSGIEHEYAHVFIDDICI